MSSAFTGFGPDTTKFLRALSQNNSKSWFDAHRDDYQEHYLAPALTFVEAIGEKMAKLAPDAVAEPRINGSIFRVNRDLRFSKDKTPYKDHIDLIFWEGGPRKSAPSSFFLRIGASSIEIGAGAHGFDSSRLAQYRKCAAAEVSGKALERAVESVDKKGFSVEGEHYKKLPRGVESVSDRRDQLLRHSALWCSAKLPHPDELRGKAFVGYCASSWRKMLPVHRWLVGHLGT